MVRHKAETQARDGQGAHRVVSSGIEITPTRRSFSQRTIKEIKLTCVHGKSLVFSGSKPGVALVDDCDTSLSCDMSVKLTVTRINRATGRRKGSCEDPQRAPIAQEQHTSSIRFPQGGGCLIRLSQGSPITPKRRRDPHTLGSPHPPVWFHDGYRPCDLAPSRWVHRRVTLGAGANVGGTHARPSKPRFKKSGPFTANV